MATITSPRTPEASAARRGRSPLDKLILTGLGANILVNVATVGYFSLQGHAPPPPLVAFAIVFALCAAVMLTRWRWAMVVPLVLSAIFLAFLLSTPFIREIFANPTGNLFAFTTFAVEVPATLLIVVVALVKLILTVRKQPTEISRGMAGFSWAISGLIIGLLLLGFINKPATGGAVSATPHNEGVSVQGTAFAPDIVALHTGDTLTITDTDSIPHILTNGTWSPENKPVPGVEPGAVILSNLSVNSGSVKVGPFTTAGTYHIYCTVHAGMRLTIVVQ